MSSKMKSNSKNVNPIVKAARERVQQVEAEKARIKALEDAETERVRKEEEEIAAAKKAIEDEKLRKQKEKEDKIAAQKEAGTFKTPAELRKEKENREKAKRLQLRQVSVQNQEVPKLKLLHKFEFEPKIELETMKTSPRKKRAPITCIMGHVDVGKTSLLDKIRNTNVQEGEVGGITQQIGASYIPVGTIRRITGNYNIDSPGLLMIDTPGHEAFSNLRKRGTKLCDIGFIIVDLVHGIEPQTIESINILRENRIPFIIALNKIDRLFGWTSVPNRMIQESLHKNHICSDEFKNRVDGIILQLNQLGINAKLFWENDSLDDTVSICPISAKTGEGVGDLLELLTKTSQPDYEEELKCIVMERPPSLEGLGTVVDVIVINGTLKKNDKIVISTSRGPVETVIKHLLTPPPNRESRVKSEYIHNESIIGAIGVKLVAPELNNIIVGSQIYLSSSKISRIPEIPEESISFELVDEGVCIHTSTHGSAEALYTYLRGNSIPISKVTIGNVLNKHIPAIPKQKQEHNVILAFNVENEVTETNITVFSDETIYRLCDQYIKFRDETIRIRRQQAERDMVFPCRLQILPQFIFNRSGEFVFGVKVLEGTIRIGTRICVPSKKLTLGRVISIQDNKKDIPIGKKGMDVCIKIENDTGKSIMYGTDRQFDHTNLLCSEISRKSLDVLKEYFAEEISKEEILLLKQLKIELGVK
jgi:translation initiation factor 5B